MNCGDTCGGPVEGCVGICLEFQVYQKALALSKEKRNKLAEKFDEMNDRRKVAEANCKRLEDTLTVLLHEYEKVSDLLHWLNETGDIKEVINKLGETRIAFEAAIKSHPRQGKTPSMTSWVDYGVRIARDAHNLLNEMRLARLGMED